MSAANLVPVSCVSERGDASLVGPRGIGCSREARKLHVSPWARFQTYAIVAAAMWLMAAPEAQSAPAGPKDRQEIEALIRTYEGALTRGDVEAILGLYSSAPVFMPQYAPAAIGRESVRQSYVWVFKTLRLNGTFHIHEVDVEGGQAWARTSSTGRFTVLATAVEADVGNNEFFLFAREGGAWKIHRYMFTANKPAGAN